MIKLIYEIKIRSTEASKCHYRQGTKQVKKVLGFYNLLDPKSKYYRG